jgi:hypothetical protein
MGGGMGGATGANPHGAMGGMGGAAGANPHGAMGGAMGAMNAVGNIEVKVVQGTKDGPAIGKTAVKLEWKHPNFDFSKYTRTRETDANGVAKFENIQAGMVTTVEGVVTLNYAGVDYAIGGVKLTADALNPKYEIKVYETTTERPAITVTLLHVDVQEWTKEHAFVLHNYTISNPTDRVWVGTGEAGKEETLWFPLPKGVKVINRNAPFREKETDAQHFVGGAPVLPGEHEQAFVFEQPVEDGKFKLALPAAMNLGRVLVHVPADDAKITPTGLTEKGTVGGGSEGESKEREFEALTVPAGAKLELAVKGIEGAQEPGGSAKNIAVIGGIGVAVIGAVVLLMRPKKVTADKSKKEKAAAV